MLLIDKARDPMYDMPMSTQSLEYQRAYRAKHRDEDRAKALAWRARNREKANAYSRSWGQRPEVKARRKARLATPEGREKMLVARKIRYHRLRAQAIEFYGGKCKCCGEVRLEFLVIDHINGGGRKDRERIGNGVNWYLYLVKNHPSHVRVLCQNCNAAIAHYGRCPHEGV